MHIAITGNIGAGKTTLSEMLSKHFGWDVQYEAVDTNPYLEDFYLDMEKWAFNLQIYFLGSRFRQITEIRKSNKNVIQDRTFYEDAYVFAENLHDMGFLSDRDFNNYRSIFHLMTSYVSAPDLLIYLKANTSKLISQITTRGRDYETTISIDYLSKLNEKYESWIKNYKEGKLLIIDMDETDFVKKPEDFGFIIENINKNINGLF